MFLSQWVKYLVVASRDGSNVDARLAQAFPLPCHVSGREGQAQTQPLPPERLFQHLVTIEQFK